MEPGLWLGYETNVEREMHGLRKKSQLVERLEAYDRNQNFRKKMMKLLSHLKCKSRILLNIMHIHSYIDLPCICIDSLQTHLDTVDKTMDTMMAFLFLHGSFF